MKLPVAFAFLRGTCLLLSSTTSKTLQQPRCTTASPKSAGRPQAVRLPDRNPEVPSIVTNDPPLSFSSGVATDLTHAREFGCDAGSPVPVISKRIRLEERPCRDGDFVRDTSNATNQTIESLHSAKPPRCASAHRGAFPMSLVVNHPSLKQALQISAVSPGCGVLIEGRRGTGKSVLARSLHNLVPPCMLRVKYNPFNIDPRRYLVDSFLAQTLQGTGATLSDLPTEMVATPFVTVPLGVQEDALIGSVDLEESLETGQTAYSPGLLAKAHRGILYVDEVNLLDEEVASLLFQCLADGSVTVEREGMSVQYPCRPLVLATYNPAEGEMRQHLVDRFALHVSADDDDLSVLDRVQGVLNVEAWLDAAPIGGQSELHELVQSAQEEDDRLRERVQSARDVLPSVELSKEQLAYLCETATRADCEGQRGELFAAMAAKASAALGNRTRVNAHDLELGVLLAIAPRARVWDRAEDLEAPPPTPTQPPDTQLTPLTHDMDTLLPDVPEPDQPEAEDQPSDDKSMEQDDDQEEEPEPEPPGEEDEVEEEELQIPLEFMFGVDESAVIDPRLLAFRKRARVGKGGKRSRTFNVDRGRFVRAIFPRGGSRRGHFAVGATLRAAAPFQLSRRLRMARRDGDKRSVVVTKDDFRIQQLKKKTGNLVIFVVDASGSMALNRMSAAKGAAMGLLQEAYQSRDKIALIAFHGTRSTVVVPPTKALALAKRRLEGLPCGSKTPLSDALETAFRLGTNAIQVKQDTGRVIVVLLTDGRANVPLCESHGGHFDSTVDAAASEDGQPSRTYLKDEAMALAQRMGANDKFDVLVIDTEDRFVGTGVARELARVAGGNYCHLARADDPRMVSHAVQQVVG